MKRFYFAIRALEQEKLRVIGKYAIELAEHNHDPLLAMKRTKVQNLNEAIKILSDHNRNVNV